MNQLLLATFLFLYTDETLADVKSREKAKFELISSIEVLVNIEECRKGIESKDIPETSLPRACNNLPYLAKYFFTKKDREAIEDHLKSEEERIVSESRKLISSYNLKKLGKMTLSEKCVKNRDPIDLDQYLNKIQGLPYVIDEAPEASTANSQVELRNPAAK